VATAAEGRLTFSATLRQGIISRGRPDQISEAILGSLIRLHPSSLRGRDPRVVGVFGVANLACDLGAGDTRSPACPQ